MSTYLALHYQSTAVAMHLGSQARQSSKVAGQEFYSLLDAIALKANAWKVYESVALPLQIRQRRPRRKLYTDTKNYNFLEPLPLPLMILPRVAAVPARPEVAGLLLRRPHGRQLPRERLA